MQVHYHNHSWEFCDNGLLWFALADQAPDVQFALDTGWALASGYDPVMLIERYPGRFGYVHLRDCKKAADPGAQTFSDVHKGFVDLGTGDMGYPPPDALPGQSPGRRRLGPWWSTSWAILTRTVICAR